MTDKPKTPPQIVRALRQWSDYCRNNGMKNRGQGKCSLVGERYNFIADGQLLPDGTVQGIPEHVGQPDEKLQKALAEAYSAIMEQRLPKLGVSPKAVGLPSPSYKDDPEVLRRTYYTYEGRDYGTVNMIVERLDFVDPDRRPKQCIPWMFYHDSQQWESGVPDGYDTPIFGQWSVGTKFMVHEGEKACLAAIAASKFDSGHPWQFFLSQFNHISWQGGAFPGAIEYTDWSPLNRNENTFFLMPDNDGDGYKAAKRVRRQLYRAKGIYCVHWGLFEKIPHGWDIADPVPMIGRQPAVSEVDLMSSFRLYEDAHRLKRSPDGKKTWYEVREEFAKKFLYFGQTDELMEADRPQARFALRTFNNWSRDLSEGKIANLGGAILDTGHVKKLDRPGYRPGGTIMSDGRWSPPDRYFVSLGDKVANIYIPPALLELKPKANAAITNPILSKGKRPWRETEKSVRPFFVYLKHLMPNVHERKMLVRWACNNLTSSNPEDRVPWAVLLVSKTQGTGKTTLGTVLSMLVGATNTSNVDGSSLKEEFTGWMEGKQLVLVEEMKEESGFRLYEKLKAPISNPVVTIRRMQTNRYDSESYISLLAMSNHLSALSVPNDDRRWFFPEVTQSLTPAKGSGLERLAVKYLRMTPADAGVFRGLWRWLKNEDGLRHLLWWMRRYGAKLHTTEVRWTTPDGDVTGLWRTIFRRAPMSAVKARVVDRSKPEWEEFLEREVGDHPVVIFEDVVEYVKQELGPKSCPRGPIVAEYLVGMGFQRSYQQTDSFGEAMELYQGGGLPTKIKGRVFSKEGFKPRDQWKNDRRKVKMMSDKWKLKIADWRPKAEEGEKAPDTEIENAPF